MDLPDDVVISGVGGRFPQCDNFEELEEKLFGKVNVVNSDKPRWPIDDLNITNAIGKINDPDVFDYTFFGIYSKVCEIMETNIRLIMAATVEALCDAGINLKDISGTNAAVVTASGLCETEYTCISGRYNIGQGMLGHSKNMEANRISYFLNTKGPSFVVNSFWNGGIQALKIAAEMVKSGEVDTAIVGASSTTLVRGEISYHYDKMGRLNKDGITRSFSEDASGYARSEAVVVFVLQKACNAKRSYGTFLGGICQSGYSTKTPIYMPNPKANLEMIKTLHEETGVKPSDVVFIEGYGGASKKLDAMELNTYAEFYLKDDRKTPLFVGSVMSNVGHCEFAASMVSLAKILISFKKGVIPPNINYSSPNPLVPGLNEEKIKIVTEATPLEGEIVGLGSYSAIGDFGYALFRRNPKSRKNVEEKNYSQNIPRLVILSGRTENSMQEVLNKVVSMPVDDEFIQLVNGLYKNKFHNYLYRAYAILDGTPNSRGVMVANESANKPIWFLFSGMGSQWRGMGKELLKIDLFFRAVQKCDIVLRPKGIDIFNILTTDDPTIFDNILHSFVGIAAVQIGLVDILRALGIHPDGIVGHSVGELGCAYADGCFTAEQMILSAYARGRASIEAELIRGMMAAVGKGYNDIKDELPPTIEVACHNSTTSCTLSGPAEDMAVYIDKLKADNVFAKLVNVSNIAYHSRYIKPAAPALLKYLQQTITNPKERSSRWVSSSVLEADWDSSLAKYSSAEYHTNNLLSPVLFEEASRHIPENAIVIEIAPHGLMQSIVKRSLPNCDHIPLTNRFDNDGVRFLLGAIGKMYTEGIDVDVSALYPKIEYPVTRETPYLHPLVTWDTSTKFIIEWDQSQDLFTKYSINYKQFQIQTTDNYWTSHKRYIHARRQIPLAYYLTSVLEFFAHKIDSESKVYSIANVKNEGTVEIKDDLKIVFELILLRDSGKFEVTNKTVGQIMTGNVCHHLTEPTKPQETDWRLGDDQLTIERDEVYNFFRHHGLVLDEPLHLIDNLKISDSGVEATIQWNGCFNDFMETAFSVITFFHSFKNNALHVITFIRQITINEKYFNGETKEFNVSYDAITNILICQGFAIEYVEVEKTKSIPKANEFLTQPVFVPFSNAHFSTSHHLFNAFNSVIQENISDVISTEGTSTTLNIINLHSDAIIKTEMEKLINFTAKLKVHLFNCPSDGAQCLESNLFGNGIVWLVVDENNAEAAISSLEDGNAHFVLTNYSEDICKNSCIVIVSDWICQKKRFLLLKQRKPTPTGEDLKTVHATKVNWKMELAEALTQTKDQNIYVIKPFQELGEIYEVLNYVDKIGFPNRIRLMLIDEKTPKYTTSSSYYNDQLKKDVKVNVSFKGKWGTLVHSVCPQVKENIRGIENFPLLAIKCPGMKIMSMGLNPKDITGNTATNLGVVEYSGIANGEPVVGLATLDESNNLTLDRHYRWGKPKNWSHHEVSSSLLPYTIASHIVEIIGENEGIRQIALVHRGALPVCQALINILSAASWKIVTTYKNDEEKEKLKSLCPKFQDDQILSCKDHSFYTSVRLKNPDGIGVVINTLKEIDLITYSMKCIDRKGICIHLNGGKSQEKFTIGMSPFLNEMKMVGVSSEDIFNLHENAKENIRNKMNEVINCSAVKPFPYEEVSNSLLNSDILSILAQRAPTENKLVVSMNKTGDVPKMFSCEDNKAYVALGETTGHTFKIIEYLVSRQAKHIYACLEESPLTEISEKRVFFILSKRPDVEIELISKDRFKTITAVTQLIRHITNSHDIGGIFLLGMSLDITASTFDKVLMNSKVSTRLISIGRGGEYAHYARYKRNEASVCVRCNTDELSPENLKYNFDNLMSLPQSQTVFDLRENNSIEIKDSIATVDTSYFPKDLEELMLYKTTRTVKPCFVEIESACPPNEFIKEIDPLFLIPGFRPVLTREIAKKLFYPTFEARLPAEFESLERAAEVLSEEIEKFNLNVVTLLADTCGGVLAFLVANKLEMKGKTISLILLDAAPDSTRKWAENDMKTLHDDTIKKYIKQLKVNHPTSVSISDVSDGIRVIRNYQNAITNSTGCVKTFSGQCTYIRLKHQESNKAYEATVRLQEMCSRSIRVEQTDETSLQKMMVSPETIKYVNQMIPFEFKDSARTLTFDDLETFG